MSILNDRYYKASILRDEYGHILIVTVTEYGAKKNHMVQCLGKSVAGPQAKVLPPVIGLDRSGRVYPTW